MPNGKPAGVPCVQLDVDLRCKIFGHPDRPAVCGSLQPSIDMCGADAAQAIHWLNHLEQQTRPGGDDAAATPNAPAATAL
jgi:hypothetical protein